MSTECHNNNPHDVISVDKVHSSALEHFENNNNNMHPATGREREREYILLESKDYTNVVMCWRVWKSTANRGNMHTIQWDG